MFRLVFRFIIITSILLLSSCKKEEYHKLKFEIEFIENNSEFCVTYSPVTCKPNYVEDNIGITTSNIKSGYVWSYEYWKLVDGDGILFHYLPTCPNYIFKMNVYVDGVLVSYVMGRSTGGSFELFDKWGLNNYTEDKPRIEFTFTK
jgi:hypothetical protein